MDKGCPSEAQKKISNAGQKEHNGQWMDLAFIRL
jgi:hypothetical protein